jgi:hypothetical protein
LLEKIFDTKMIREKKEELTKGMIEEYFKEIDLETRKSKTREDRLQIKI